LPAADRRSQTAATGTITIRDAVESDLPAISEIYNAAIATRMVTAQLEPVTPGDARDWLREHAPDRFPLWVLEIDGEIAGYLGFKPFLPRCAYQGTAELSVYVDQRFRRRGVAKKLLEEALARAPRLGINALVGLIFGQNEPSLILFEQFGFTRWGLLPRVARVNAIEQDLVVMGRHCGESCSHGSVSRSVSMETTPATDVPQARGDRDPFDLMQTLIEYRQQPIHGELEKIRAKYSMLHLDVLLLIYHFARTCAGHILEIGAFLGGATIGAALGVRASGESKKLMAIEPGGSLKHSRLGSRDIWHDFERNLRKQRLSEFVISIKGYSFEPATIAAVHEALGPDEIGLLIIDADGAVKRHLDCYKDRLSEGCWTIIDDYLGPAQNIKVTPTRKDVDDLVDAGRLEPLGFYGWGTWIGRWRGGGS
jgi:L-amino acid N-acyltransferase YncA